MEADLSERLREFKYAYAVLRLLSTGPRSFSKCLCALAPSALDRLAFSSAWWVLDDEQLIEEDDSAQVSGAPLGRGPWRITDRGRDALQLEEDRRRAAPQPQSRGA